MNFSVNSSKYLPHIINDMLSSKSHSVDILQYDPYLVPNVLVLREVQETINGLVDSV